MDRTRIRILVVDDFDSWRRYHSTALGTVQGLQVIGEASDGLEAVQKAQELQPDLILLDVGLPKLHGIDAARRIREVSPRSKILFVSENRSTEIAEEGFETGAGGYLLKSDATSELLPAVKAILEGKKFLSRSLAVHASAAHGSLQSAAARHCHEVAFYADESALVNGYARFIESSLDGGNAVLAVVIEPHRASLLLRLKADGVDVAASTQQGRLSLFDARTTLSQLIVDEMPDPILCRDVVGDLIMSAARRIKESDARVVVCGEIAPILLSRGNAEGAIELEHLWDQITRDYGVQTLCGYLWSAFPGAQSNPFFPKICTEHTGVHENYSPTARD